MRIYTKYLTMVWHTSHTGRILERKLKIEIPYLFSFFWEYGENLCVDKSCTSFYHLLRPRVVYKVYVIERMREAKSTDKTL